jgi:ABC-2 type transport system permease protein
MFAIFKKEINAFFSSLIGYLVIGIFLLSTGLLMWFFPDTSLLEYRFASLDQLFYIAPWVLIFLIPAVTMRSFAEEKQTGTMELLATRPLRDIEVILGKYFACWCLVLFAIVPTLIYYYSVNELKAGNTSLDHGAIIGSYFGLVLLAAVFTAIGVFASSLTTNQIVAFLLAMFACFVVYIGFDYTSRLPIFLGKSDDFVQKIGIDAHYRSVARGVIDFSDTIYFLSITAFFIFLTKLALDRSERKRAAYTAFGLATGILILLNVVASFSSAHLDLTEEKRFTLTKATIKQLRELKENVFIKVYLDGQLPSGFKHLQAAVRDMLTDFHRINPRVEFQFENPQEGSKTEMDKRRKQLADEGIVPVRLNVKDAKETIEQYIFPVMLFNYGGRKEYVSILENEPMGKTGQQNLNASERLLEYKCSNALLKLQANTRPNILFTAGHGELAAQQTADLERNLRQFYNIGRLYLDSVVQIPAQDTFKGGNSQADVVIVAKPTTAFSEKDKFKLDQYVMHGGRVIWLIDRLNASMEGMQQTGEMMPTDYPLNIEDQLFKYGIRIQPNLIVDLECSRIDLQVGAVSGQPQYDKLPWFYFPTIAPNAKHLMTKSLDRVNLQFPSSIDTVRTKTDVTKTILLASSKYSRVQFAPTRLNFEILRYKPEIEKFNQPNQPIAVLLEGVFPSLYENRVSDSMSQGLAQLKTPFMAQSTPTQMLVVSDGDIVRNDVDTKRGVIVPLGFNRTESYTFANKDFMLNAIEYMLHDGGFIEARTRDIKLRLLDGNKAESEKTYWRVLNILAPLVFLLIFGLIFTFLRRRKYGV